LYQGRDGATPHMAWGIWTSSSDTDSEESGTKLSVPVKLGSITEEGAGEGVELSV